MPRVAALSLMLGFAVTVPAVACSLCGGQQAQTLRQKAQGEAAKVIVFGAIANPRQTGGAFTTDLQIQAVLKTHPLLGSRKLLELARYLPVSDPKNPPRYLVFADVFNDKLDVYYGAPFKSPAVVDYLKGALAIDAKDAGKRLLYFFRFLDHADADIANDAYLEFAKATDQEIGHVASQLSAEKLRAWLKDPVTPANRLGLYAFLLGACGNAADAKFLRSLLDNPAEPTAAALDGILGGYIQLQPQEGWNLVFALLKDERRPFPQRFAVLRTLRFFHGWKPAETRTPVLRGLEIVVPQGDLADLAIEDLRRWQMWDLTKNVLAQYGKPSHDAPVMKQAIVRYALSCPQPEATAFVAERRKSEPELVKGEEDSLQAEKRN
jgi:hypothetical protein